RFPCPQPGQAVTTVNGARLVMEGDEQKGERGDGEDRIHDDRPHVRILATQTAPDAARKGNPPLRIRTCSRGAVTGTRSARGACMSPCGATLFRDRGGFGAFAGICRHVSASCVRAHLGPWWPVRGAFR